jgi:ABC-type nitrate/sulfonate/bicarbonate transport system substrate-binding protein
LDPCHEEDRVTNKLDRRAFLRTGALGAGGVVLLGGSPRLPACGDDDDTEAAGSSGGSGGPDFGTLDYQLSWIKNVEFAGQYIADTNGYYRDEGFESVNFIAGGPNVTQDTVVASGDAFVGISGPDLTGPAILEGAPLKAVGALLQKNPFAMLSLAENPLSTPEDMLGKKIGVQDVNLPVWEAFLTANEIDPSEIDVVPVQFDPQPLTTGEVDGWFSFFTNEPNLLRVQGIEVEVFLLSDFNYPLVSQIYVVRVDSIENERDKIKALLEADIRGWRDSLVDPALGARLTVEDYGSDLGLDEEEQVLESEDQNSIILTDDTRANGILTVTDELVEGSIESLRLGGIEITAEQLFDLSLLAEVYEENPDLKEPPA